MEANRKFWNEQQKILQNALTHGQAEAVDLFLRQHAMVHSDGMSGARLWSFEDEVFEGLSDQALRSMPGEHSIAWMLLHMARVEDVTMNLLVAGSPQIFIQDRWQERLKIGIRHTGNAMDEKAIAGLSAEIDLEALKAYRLTVGRRTREIVQALEPSMFKQKIEPARLQRIWDEGAVLADAREIVDYWSRRTVAGLLLMPPTRHNFVHLNEALRVKRQLQAKGL